MGEREKFKQEIERLKAKNRNLELKNSQMEDQINDYRSENSAYRTEVDTLKQKIRHKDETIYRSKLLKDKANASFEVESNSHLFDETKHVDPRHQQNQNDNHINFGDKRVAGTQDSDDFSRAHPSGDKQKKNTYEMKKGEMFDHPRIKSPEKDSIIENSWFFKVINELFAPYKKC